MHGTVSVVAALLALVATPAVARTDLAGCTSTASGATNVWYVPGTGEICSLLDCGGGRAPPKTNVPGCPGYQGTETVKTSFLPGFAAPTSDAAAMAPSASATPGTNPAATAVPTSPAAAASSAASSAHASGASTSVTLPSQSSNASSGAAAHHSVASGGPAPSSGLRSANSTTDHAIAGASLTADRMLGTSALLCLAMGVVVAMAGL